jgi:GT2 family glycosyltransferase
MDISLIICTRNRAPQLTLCLAAVGAIRAQRDWEVIVVDNASETSDTAEVARAFAARASVPVQFVIEPCPGLAHGHNRGVALARGRYLAFIDDDCYPAPDYIEALCAAFDGDPTLGYLSGRIMLHDPTDLALTVNESLIPRVFPPRRYVQTGDVQGANMAFRPEVLAAIGGFDPWFGPGAPFNAEDIDAAARANLYGWKGAYCPTIVVSHHHGRKPDEAARVWRSYATGRGAYNMKLLLNGEFWWFARAIYGLRNRWKLSRGTIWYEQVGAARYACMRLRARFDQRRRGWCHE